MTPKSRMFAALERRKVDRVPVGEIGVDYPITERALGHETLYRAKWKEYQAYWQGRRDEIVESYKQDIVALARKFEWDFVPAPLVPPRRSSYAPPEFLDTYRWREVDGSEWVYSPLTEGHAIRASFPEMAVGDLPTPQPLDESRLEVVEHVVKQLGGTHFILGRPGVDGSFPYDETVGLQEFLLRMISEPEFVRQATNVYTELTLIEHNALFDAGCDAVLPGADYCGTHGPMMSPAHFRQFIFPSLKKMCDQAHARGRYLIKHTDGLTWKILPLIIEAGCDAWHGIQPSIGMDLARLKEMYGQQLLFIGGVDCDTLVAGTPDQVRREVRYAIEHAGQNGGLAISSSNTLMVGVKYENYMALLETVKEIQPRG